MAILECKDLSKRFGSVDALTDVSFAVEPGRIVGLLGPNGSGKTTLIKLVNGLLTPTSGQVLIDGEAPGKRSHSLVSYLPDRNCLPQWMTAGQLLEIPEKRRMKQLSKGTREKVQLILVMSRAARLYLLDEPIGGVDPATRAHILQTIIGNYNPEASVILSTHLIADVEKVLDDVLFIHQGHIMLRTSVDQIREEKGMSVDQLFREVFKC